MTLDVLQLGLARRSLGDTLRAMRHAMAPVVMWRHLQLVCSVAAMAFIVVPAARGQTRNANSTATITRQADAHLGRGYTDLKSDRYDDAVREFRAALQLDPKLTLRARFPLAVALFESHQLDEARREFEAVRREAGDRADVMYYLGRLDFEQGAADAAIRELTVASAHPLFPDTAYYLGSAYLSKHELPLAEKWLQAAARLSPRDPHVEERLAEVYGEEGRKEDAQKARARAAELRQESDSLAREKLDCVQALDHGSLEAARPVCQSLYEPDDAGRLTLLGTIYGQHGDFKDALKPLTRAAELEPGSAQMQYNLALDYFELQRYSDARQSLEKVVKAWPDLFALNALYGAALFQLREDSLAYKALGHAHELNPGDPETTKMLFESAFSLAGQSSRARDYPAAARYLSEAAQLLPQQPEPHRLLAEVYKATGREREAAEEQKQFKTLLAGARGSHNE